MAHCFCFRFACYFIGFYGLKLPRPWGKWGGFSFVAEFSGLLLLIFSFSQRFTAHIVAFRSKTSLSPKAGSILGEG
jgi:hypothetical protein